MGTISVSLPSDGSAASVSQYNTPITTIINAINGGLDNSNIATGAAISPSKISGLNPTNFSNPYKFFAYRSSTWTTATSAAAIVFNSTIFDTGTNYSTSTGSFTAPIGGFYEFFVTVGSGGSVRTLLSIYKNGSEFIRLYDSNTVTTGPLDVNGSCFLSLSANDTVQVFLTAGSAVTGGFGTTPYYTTFSGNLVSAT